jgi:hypothetical protein
VLALLLSFLSPVADRLSYALPWRLPATVHYHNRDYIEPSPCMARSQVVASYGSIRRVGSVFGWLTSSPTLYVRAIPPGLDSTLAFVDCGRDRLVVYALSGGP